jgi:hypothetical protein
VIIAQATLGILLVYLVCGLAVGVPFVLRGVDRVDASAQGASLGFRLLILPGTVALWPLMATKWIVAPRSGGHP